MPHRIGKCRCGRAIHMPRGSKAGDTWTCHQCRRTYTLTANGPGPVGRAFGIQGQRMGLASSHPYAPAQRSTSRNPLSVLFAWLLK